MRDVYRKASHAIIWLGAKSSSGDRALEFLSRALADSLDGLWDSEGWDSLDELLARPWWSRAWVLQEAILQCGSSIISWNIIERASSQLALLDNLAFSILWANEDPRREKNSWKGVLTTVDATTPLLERLVVCLLIVCPYRLCLWESNKRRYGLVLHLVGGKPKGSYGSIFSDLLWNTWDREAADPRDKIHSIIAVAGSELLPRIIPDYSKPMEHVYKEVARSIMMTEKHLDILLAANGVAGTDLLPSWPPDWRTEANDLRPTLLINGNRMFTLFHFGWFIEIEDSHCCLFSASGGSEATFELDSTLDTLTVLAVIFDKIADMTKTVCTSETRHFWDRGAFFFPDPTTADLQQLREDVGSAYMLAARSRGISLNNQAHAVDTSLEKEVNEVLAAGYARKFYGRRSDEGIYRYMYHVAANIMRRRRVFRHRNRSFWDLR
ncbi:hypothetical protein GGS24DRAFT_445271 [Hypoxylon argillaceum]|nr:hypothetical protein GGS24DRAFT_445271 [Hypoxylon argillaceum]